MRDGGRGRRWLVALWRVVRWEPRSYWQIWLLFLAAYLACAVGFTLADGWRQGGATAFWLGGSGGFIGGAVGSSIRLAQRRRRNADS